MKALITRKLGMTSLINEDGSATAVTLLSAKPNTIIQLKDTDKNGYNAVQLGTEETKLSKSAAGHQKNAKSKAKVIREFTIEELPEGMNVGDTLSADVFEVGDTVDVVGTSKGKGWAGTIKRHNFHRGRKTHGGQSYRRPGSIGSMYPQKIFKGKKMAGQMGAERTTIKKLTVAMIDNELGVIGVSGAVPGPKKGLVLIKVAK